MIEVGVKGFYEKISKLVIRYLPIHHHCFVGCHFSGVQRMGDSGPDKFRRSIHHMAVDPALVHGVIAMRIGELNS